MRGAYDHVAMTTLASATGTPHRRRYRTKPLVVHPPELVPLSRKDEERAIAAFAPLLAPLFNADGPMRCEAEEERRSHDRAHTEHCGVPPNRRSTKPAARLITPKGSTLSNWPSANPLISAMINSWCTQRFRRSGPLKPTARVERSLPYLSSI